MKPCPAPVRLPLGASRSACAELSGVKRATSIRTPVFAYIIPSEKPVDPIISGRPTSFDTFVLPFQPFSKTFLVDGPKMEN